MVFMMAKVYATPQRILPAELKPDMSISVPLIAYSSSLMISPGQ